MPRRPLRAPAAPAKEDILNALAAMRSAAELLRDVPDLRPAERRRFAAIVVDEGQRLEALISGNSATRRA